MKNSDIIGIIENAIISKIGKEWKHDVIIQNSTYNYIVFEIDGEKYDLLLQKAITEYNKGT